MSERVDQRQRVKAAAAGQAEWGTWGSAQHHDRYKRPIGRRSRSRCGCGCRTRATHVGFANGVALMSGCEWEVSQWVRDGLPAGSRARLRHVAGVECPACGAQPDESCRGLAHKAHWERAQKAGDPA